MPFTPSHAVAALPFVRTPLVPAAIAIGAMTPDLPIFLRGIGLRYSAAHTLEWLPVTMLVALALLLVWRCVLRPGVRDLSPTWVARRLPGEWDATAAAGLRETFGVRGGRASAVRIVMLVLSLALGVVSHIVWDAFTHEGRWGLELLPALDAAWGPLPGYKWLQHGSGVVGLAIIGVWAIVWIARRTPTRFDPTLPRWVRPAVWAALPLILLAAAGLGLVLYGPLRTGFGVEHLLYAVMPPACAAWGLVVAAAGVAAGRARRRAQRP